MMTVVEIWSLRDGRKEDENVHDLFCKRVMGATNDINRWHLREELEKTNRNAERW
jgi:hypothetical protein